jgi:hypothetical protein
MLSKRLLNTSLPDAHTTWRKDDLGLINTCCNTVSSAWFQCKQELFLLFHKQRHCLTPIVQRYKVYNQCPSVHFTPTWMSKLTYSIYLIPWHYKSWYFHKIWGRLTFDVLVATSSRMLNTGVVRYFVLKYSLCSGTKYSSITLQSFAGFFFPPGF